MENGANPSETSEQTAHFTGVVVVLQFVLTTNSFRFFFNFIVECFDFAFAAPPVETQTA